MDRDWTRSFSIRFQNGTCIIILDKKYNTANSSCHFGSYGSIWTGPSPNKYYMDIRSFGPYNIFLVTDRSIYCYMTLSAMNYLLYITLLVIKILCTHLSQGKWQRRLFNSLTLIKFCSMKWGE
jgi:hypothetical protein